MEKGYFASDLHLLANRSTGQRAWTEIRRRAVGAKMFVLGGDIFDFRWATTPTLELAVERAANCLRRLISECPNCHFHYLLGNHDYHRKFIERLDPLAAEAANLSWHRFHLRLGSSAFLHGDVADRRMNVDQFAARRSRWLEKRKRGPFSSGLYDLVVAAGFHKPIPHLSHRKRTMARRILAYLHQVGHGPDQGVRNVYFGHTHRVLPTFAHGGLTFHNGGAAIKGVKHRILEVDHSW
jgi:UDP-2,3-diacylglucosamine hydrolase